MIVSLSSGNRERNAWNMQPLPLYRRYNHRSDRPYRKQAGRMRRKGRRQLGDAFLAKQPTKLLLRAFQFVRERTRIVSLAKRFDDGRGIDRDRTCLRVCENTVEHE